MPLECVPIKGRPVTSLEARPNYLVCVIIAFLFQHRDRELFNWNRRMPACAIAPADRRRQARLVGNDLVTNFGKKNFYTPAEIQSANRRQSIPLDYRAPLKIRRNVPGKNWAISYRFLRDQFASQGMDFSLFRASFRPFYRLSPPLTQLHTD